MKPSEQISNFLNFVADARRLHALAIDNLKKEEKRQEDLLHEIEFCKSAKDRNKLGTKLHKCREERRNYKDIKELYDPIVSFADEPVNKKVVDKLSSNLLGQVRKTESYHENRIYRPRLKEETK